MILHGALSVFRFELRRTLTVSRISVWLLLVLFPVFIVSVMKYYEKDSVENSRLQFEAPIKELESIDGKGRRFAVDLEELKNLPEHEWRKYILDKVMTYYGQEFAAKNRRQPGMPLDTIDIIVGQGRRFSIDLKELKELRPDEMPKYLQDLAARELMKAAVGVDQPDKRVERDAAEPPPPVYPTEVWGAVFFGLIPEVITLFGLLLWVTPLVHSELEGRTWIYLAVRPRGRVSVLLGKYLSAVTWTAVAGWLSATICVFVARPADGLRLWATIVALVAFSSVAYAALYSLIGVWLHRRAMVIAVAYTLIFELLVSLIPAVINKFTVQYRLRNLLFDWMHWRELIHEEAQGVEVFLGDEPTWLHIVILLGIVVGVLAIAAQVIQRKEYVSAAEA